MAITDAVTVPFVDDLARQVGERLKELERVAEEISTLRRVQAAIAGEPYQATEQDPRALQDQLVAAREIIDELEARALSERREWQNSQQALIDGHEKLRTERDELRAALDKVTADVDTAQEMAAEWEAAAHGHLDTIRRLESKLRGGGLPLPTPDDPVVAVRSNKGVGNNPIFVGIPETLHGQVEVGAEYHVTMADGALVYARKPRIVVDVEDEGEPEPEPEPEDEDGPEAIALDEIDRELDEEPAPKADGDVTLERVRDVAIDLGMFNYATLAAAMNLDGNPSMHRRMLQPHVETMVEKGWFERKGGVSGRTVYWEYVQPRNDAPRTRPRGEPSIAGIAAQAPQRGDPVPYVTPDKRSASSNLRDRQKAARGRKLVRGKK